MFTTADNLETWPSYLYEGSAHFWLSLEDQATLNGMNSFYNYFSSSTADIIGEDRIDLDLIISDVQMQFIEFDKIVPHIGDTFSHFFYGQQPVVLNVSGHLINTLPNRGKHEFMELYRGVFRLSRVAKTGIAPFLSFVGCNVQGAMINVHINDSGASQDTLAVKFQYLVFLIRFLSEENLTINSINYNAALVD
jgi:hypothetical protein